MSRFVEALDEWNEEISYQSVRRLLENIKARLGARRAWARFCFPYFVRKAAPASGSKSAVAYECRLTRRAGRERTNPSCWMWMCR